MFENTNVARLLKGGDLECIAVIDGKVRVSFGELEALTTQAGVLLKNKGFSRGDKVLLMVKPGVHLIVLMFGLLKLGAVPVLIDPGMGVKHFVKCVRRTEPVGFVGVPIGHVLKAIFLRKVDSIRKSLWVRGSFLKQCRQEDAGGLVCSENSAKDLAAILFTSGSTGAPKGVLYTHGVLNAQVEILRKLYGIEPGEVDLPLLPVFSLFNPVLGVRTVVPEVDARRPARLNAKRVVAQIEGMGVNSAFGSPVLWERIAGYCEEAGVKLEGLKRILMAGAAVPVSLVERLKVVAPRAVVHTPYGATEILPVSTLSGDEILECAAEGVGEGTSVGKAVPGVEIKIIRPVEEPIASISDIEEVAEGEIGEIIVRGPTMTGGYHRMEEATAQARIYDKDGEWHRMGDMGYVDRRGHLRFCGRKVERVLLKGGQVLYTDLMESVFNRHPDVERCALIGAGGKAGLVVQSKKRFEMEALMEFAKGYEEAGMIERIFFVDAMPVDVRHNAKIHRLALAERFKEGLLG